MSNGTPHKDVRASYKAVDADPPPGRGGLASAFGSAVPLLIGLGGAIAAAIAAEKTVGGVSRAGRAVGHAAHETADHAGDWLGSARRTVRHGAAEAGESLLSAGAKAAGMIGLLKAIGGGNFTGAASAAAKAVAAKKVAEYLAGAGKSAAKVGAKAGATVGGLKLARRVAPPPPKPSNLGSNLATGAAILGVGAAAVYLFDPTNGPDRRRRLRHAVLGTGRTAAHDARKAAAHYYNEARHAVGRREGADAEPQVDVGQATKSA